MELVGRWETVELELLGGKAAAGRPAAGAAEQVDGLSRGARAG